MTTIYKMRSPTMSGTHIYYSEDMNLYHKTTRDSDYVTTNGDGRLEVGLEYSYTYGNGTTQVDQESLVDRRRYPSTFTYYRRVRYLDEGTEPFRRPMRITWMNFRTQFELAATSPFVYLTLYMNGLSYTRMGGFNSSRLGNLNARRIRKGDFFIQKRPDEGLQGKNTLAFGCVCPPADSDYRQPEFIPLKVASNNGDITIVKASSSLPRYYDVELAPYIGDYEAGA